MFFICERLGMNKYMIKTPLVFVSQFIVSLDLGLQGPALVLVLRQDWQVLHFLNKFLLEALST